jgi:hypothetical protein
MRRVDYDILSIQRFAALIPHPPSSRLNGPIDATVLSIQSDMVAVRDRLD